MPAEPRRPAALPSEPAREARRRRPHSLDAGLVPDRGRDEAQRGEPRGGEGRGADWNLGVVAAPAVRHGRARRRHGGSCGGARWSVQVGVRAHEAGGEQDIAKQAILRHRWRVNAEKVWKGYFFAVLCNPCVLARPAKGCAVMGRSTAVVCVQSVVFSMRQSTNRCQSRCEATCRS